MGNGTWNFVDSPPSKGSKLVYRIKRLLMHALNDLIDNEYIK